MSRVIVYVDGFNLYHAINDLKDNSLKWLCLRSLSESLLRNGEELQSVKYFSAYATWRPQSYARHRSYVDALKAEGVRCIMGKFKERKMECRSCHVQYSRHEEKETDVNIAIHLIRDTFESNFDRAVVISADSDMRSAVAMAREISGTKKIDVVAPPKRITRARALEPIYEIPVSKVRSSRLRDSYQISNGRIVEAPSSYRRH